MASGNPIYGLLWILLLVFIAWPLAGFAAGFYILLQPFESLFSVIKDLNAFLERFVTWPRECGKAIVNCKTSFPQP
jgi:hypothetical protein